MTSDLWFSVIFVCLLTLSFLIGALAGALRRDRDWRIFLADQRSADFDKHWETAIRE